MTLADREHTLFVFFLCELSREDAEIKMARKIHEAYLFFNFVVRGMGCFYEWNEADSEVYGRNPTG